MKELLLVISAMMGECTGCYEKNASQLNGDVFWCVPGAYHRIVLGTLKLFK